MTDRSDSILAAEHVLGLLEGEERLAAISRAASDAEFASEIERWRTYLAPLLDQNGGAEPSAEVWHRIEQAIAETGSTGEIVALQKRVKRWRWIAGASIAASLALATFAFLPTTAPVDTPSRQLAEAPLVSSIPIAGTDLRLAVTYLPDRQEMLVSASGLAADGVHDHELWLVPPEGELRSLGVVRPGEEVRVALDPALAELIGDGSEMLLTREPLGGKPAGAEAGPVVAQGEFQAI